MRFGWPRERYDVARDPICHDMSTPQGFIFAVKCLLQVVENGLLWGGCPCSSFVYISRATSKRTREAIMGDESVEFVLTGNLLAARCSLLIILALARCVRWTIEQPGSLLLPGFPPIRKLLYIMAERKCFHVTRFAMGYFGSLSLKPTMVFGSAWGPQMFLLLQVVLSHMAFVYPCALL